MESTYETSSHDQNEQVQNVYHCCLCLIFDQTTMAQEQEYLNDYISFNLGRGQSRDHLSGVNCQKKKIFYIKINN